MSKRAELGLYFPMKPTGQELVQRAFENVGDSIGDAERAGEDFKEGMEDLEDQAGNTGKALDDLSEYAGMTREQFEAGAKAWDEFQGGLDRIGGSAARVRGGLEDLTEVMGIENEFISATVIPGLKGLEGTMDLVTGTVQLMGGIFQAGHSIMTAAQWAFNVAANANPFAIIAIAIIAALGLLYAAWETNFMGIRDILEGAWAWFEENFGWLITVFQEGIPVALNVLKGVWDATWGAIGAALQAVWDHVLNPVFGAIQGALNTIGGAVNSVGDFFGDVFGHSVIVDSVRATRDELRDLLPDISRELGGVGVGGFERARTQFVQVSVHQHFAGGVSTMFDWDEALARLETLLAQRVEAIP